MYISKYFKKNQGLTLVELMIVVALISILTAAAVPTVGTMRKKARDTTCIANLRQIDSAIEQWSLFTNGVFEGADLTSNEDGIYSFLYGERPVCASGGTYTLGTLGVHPQVRCNVQDHALPGF